MNIPHSAFRAPPSLSASASPLTTAQGISLSPPTEAIKSSLETLNNYFQKYHDRFIEQESLKRNRLIASFAEKEQTYERQISTLKAIRADVSGLLVREQVVNDELREKLDDATGSIARLCKAVTDANFSFVDRKQGSREIKQEESSGEGTNVSDVIICPDAAISSLLSRIEAVVAEMDAQNGVGLPSPVDVSPRHSILEALERVVVSLLATQRTFLLLQEDFKSVGAARENAERQNESLQGKITLLQEELKQVRCDNERISQELASARLEKENHICRPLPSTRTTPAIQDEFPASLPSPPLERGDLCIPNDILQDTVNISRKPNQAFLKKARPENAHLSPRTPIADSGPRKISLGDAIKRVQTNSATTTAPGGPSIPPVARDHQQTTGPSTPLHSTPTQGIKRTSNGAHKCHGTFSGPPPSQPTSALSSSISTTTNDPRLQKKRRLNAIPGTSATNRKHKPVNENPLAEANDAHTPAAPDTVSPVASSSKYAAVQLPKTRASDLKSLKFNKKPEPSGPPLTPAMTTSSSNAPKLVATPVKSGGLSMKPLDLAKKSPQERAALRKSK